jgi:soluble lytic murein transglycosylase
MAFQPTATPTTTPTPTLTPTPTPTPTPLPEIRLGAADRALFNGDWDQALALYQEAAAYASEPDKLADAELGVGAALLEAGRYPDAIQTLGSYLTSYPDHVRYGQAYFLRAQAHASLGMYAEAAADYQQYLQSRPGLIDSYAQEYRGDALWAAGDPASAIDAYRAALDSTRAGDELAIQIKVGQAQAAADDHESAIETFRDVYIKTSSESTKAQMDYLMGLSYFALEQPWEAYTRYLDAVENYPREIESYWGLITLVEDGVVVSELDRGIVDYYAGQNGVALAAFDRYIQAVPDHQGEVYYYRGLALRATGSYALALDSFAVLIERYPESPFWDEAWEQKAYTEWGYLDAYADAEVTLLDFVARAPDHARAPEFLFDAARVAERSGDLERAASLWTKVAEDYPASEWVYEALFLAGISNFRIERADLASELFQQSLAAVRQSSERAAAYLWIGKSHQTAGEQDQALAAWRLASEADPDGYYGLRAEELIEGREPFQSLGVYDFSYDEVAERQEAEEWMRKTFAITDPEPLSTLSPVLAQDPRMNRAKELMQLRLFGHARREYEALQAVLTGDAEANFRLMHHYLEVGMYQPAIYTAVDILRLGGLEGAAASSAPTYFHRIRFGNYFGEIILPEALTHGFDGLLLLSVVRQESLFEGFATSYAAARGLMQIIPSTGQMVADQLGWPPGYEDDDLYRPLVSVRLGTQYLADQRELFEGDLYASLAAYNAGPGNALAWKALVPDDPDLFLEVVRLDQPQRYIQVIFWAYTHYQDLYIQP